MALGRGKRFYLVAAVGTLVTLTTAQSSFAQDNLGAHALNQLEPTPSGDTFFAIPSALVGGHLALRGGVLFDYSNGPLRLVGANGIETPFVSSQAFVSADVSLALWDRLLVSARLPIALMQSGEPLEGVSITPPNSAAVSDIRLGLRGRIVGDARSPFQAGLGANLFVPVGNADSFVGEGKARSDVHFALGGAIGRFVWGASAGVHLRASTLPHALRFGAAAGVTLLADRLRLGIEAFGQRPLGTTVVLASNEADIQSEPRVGFELLGSARMKVVRGLFLGAAGGPGLTSAFGTPAFRVLGTVGWAPVQDVGPTKPILGPTNSPVDRDGDGFRDDVDACPDEKGELGAEPGKDGCPPPDRDKDGVLDVDDACPLVAGEKSTKLDRNGCPGDADQDGFVDPEDACPKEKGIASDNPKKRGCPVDRDDDGVTDALDACPDKPGAAVDDPAQRGCPDDLDGDGIKWPEDRCPRERGSSEATEKGCPRFVRLSGDELLLSSPVEIALSRKARGEAVTDASVAVLEEVRDVLRDHPEILVLEVGAHTDDSGDIEKKAALSQKRAELVVDKLVELGVARDRLHAVGHGHKKPIADNRLPEGRKKNQRVTFTIESRRK